MHPDLPPKVLVVDDNRFVRDLVRDTFTEAGLEVRTAGNGREALEAVAEDRPDLIVTDAAMPEMDGWALCEAVKANPATRDIPLIFLAAQREIPDRLRGLRLGAHDYVCKPFSTEELLLRVQKILEHSGRVVPSEPSSKTMLAGHTSHMPPPDLIQLLAMNTKTGCLRLHGEEHGRIHFREGKVVGAFTTRTHGLKAMIRMLGWTNVEFSFDAGDDPLLGGELAPATQRLLMDALVAIDDLERLRPHLPPEDRRLLLAEGARALFSNPGELTQIQKEVLKAAAEKATFGEMLDRIGETDLEAAQVVHDLLRRGALVSAD